MLPTILMIMGIRMSLWLIMVGIMPFQNRSALIVIVYLGIISAFLPRNMRFFR